MAEGGTNTGRRRMDQAANLLVRATDALLHASDELELLNQICQIGAEAGHCLAWIGYTRPAPDRKVEVMAKAGRAKGYLDDLKISWNDDDWGNGPTGLAIRSGQPYVVSDTETDSIFAPWRERAAQFGFRSSVTLPVGEGDNRIGALMFYAEKPGMFDHHVVGLLMGVARNLSHGISTLRMRRDHQQIVKELAESEQRYRSLVELAPDAIVVHGRGSILFANHAAIHAFGAGPSMPLTGRSVLELVHPQSRPDALERLDSPPPGHMLSHYRLLRQDGTAFDAEVLACSISFHGAPARLLVIRDISERARVEETLLQTAKLATLGEMAAGLVHELSQPLNIIRLTAEGALMLIERGKAPQDFQTQQFTQIAEQCERTAEIIDDIRIFSRRDTTPVQVFDAILAVRSAIEVLIGQFRPDGIAILHDLPAASMPVRGRRVQLEQVVMNLLNNAHHALRDSRQSMPSDWEGEISIHVERRAEAVIIRIVDNGPGIPDHMKARIFEPFFTTKEAGRGTGLGLSVSHGLVTAMNGSLILEDQGIGTGAAFAISLPLDLNTAGPEPLPALSPSAALTSTSGDSHILVVDDEITAAQALAHYLRELGYRVSVAGTGIEAWTLFSNDPADVVITDLRMPAGNGEQLVEKLRDFDPLLPIVIVTGHLGATERVAANLEDDRCAVLKKPVALAQLGELVTIFLKPPA
ncbi:MAG: response regulator [Magnetospirillum sp.]|nr:response regulator [Magnetospirillum sp.]